MNNVSLTPELIRQVQELLERSKLDPRSASLGPMKNLNHDPAQKYVPTFFWSVGARDVPSDWNTTETFPFPRLLWDVNGVEIRVENQEEMDAKVAAGYLLANPEQRAETPEERFQREFNSLNAEDQAFLLNAIEEQRKAKLLELAGSMTPEKLMAMTGQQKRGPGRPKKVVNE